MAQSAQDILRSILDEYGLGELSSWAWGLYLNSGATSLETFQPELFEKMKQTEVFKAKFPAYQTLINQGRGITVEEYRTYTEQIQTMAHQFGIPAEMYGTPDAIGKMLSGGISAAEAADRMRMAAQAVYSVPDSVKEAMRSQYGIDQGGLIAYWLDPDLAQPLLEKQFTAAQVGGAAREQGLAVDRATAERLAQEGVGYQQAQQGFAQAKSLEGLQYAGGDAVNMDQITSGVFGNQTDRQEVQRIQRARQAEFQQSGGASETQRGVSGLGTTSR